MFYRNNARQNTTRRFIYITGISEEELSKEILFTLQSDKQLSYKVFLGQSIVPYSYYFPGDANELSSISIFSISPQKIKLMNNEYFFVLFENLGNYLSLSISEEEITPDSTDKEEEEEESDKTDKKEDESDKSDDKSDKKKDEKKGEEGLESWKTALIVIGVILALIILVVIVFYFLRKNKRVTDKTIEQKMENLTDLRE